MSQAVDLFVPFKATSDARYQTSGLEIVNIVEVQLLGITSDNTADNEVWIEFDGPRPGWLSRTLTESDTQHLTGKFALPLPGSSNQSGVFLPVPLKVAYNKRGSLQLPMSLSIRFYDKDGALLSHSGILFMRFITNTPQ